jgi:hypothetical protein
MGSLHTYTSVTRSSRFLATALCHSVVHATATSSMYTRTGVCVGDNLSYVGWFRTGIGVAMDCRGSGMDYAREMLTMVCIVHMACTLCQCVQESLLRPSSDTAERVHAKLDRSCNTPEV